MSQINNLIPLDGMWYKVTAVAEDGTLTLTKQGQTAKALKRLNQAHSAFEKRLRGMVPRGK